MNTPITRKTLVQLIGGDMSVIRLRDNEKRWGLDAARIKTNTRSVLYFKEKALKIWASLGSKR